MCSLLLGKERGRNRNLETRRIAEKVSAKAPAGSWAEPERIHLLAVHLVLNYKFRPIQELVALPTANTASVGCVSSRAGMSTVKIHYVIYNSRVR
jgi:hypothetical protein